MEQFVVEVFRQYGNIAILISIVISMLVSVAGVLPSVFVTAANLTFFGFIGGIAISLAGEALGAIVSFCLYRKGIQKIKIQTTNKLIGRLQMAKGVEAFVLIIVLRLFPFAPSGLVTLAGAGSRMGLFNYSVASTAGKVPALLLEAYAVWHVMEWQWQAQLLLAVLAGLTMAGLYFLKRKRLD
ncbi:MAG: TVP38/TMEM64 family protein [Bacillus sp. (in: firmicutes)]